MSNIKSRLSTVEHILARVLENKFSDLKVRIVRFYENYGEVEFLCSTDLRNTSKDELEKSVQSVVDLNLNIKEENLSREEAAKKIDLSRISKEFDIVRIISIGDFDCRGCGDPHVENTSDIGKFEILKVRRVGDSRYRYKFRVL